MMGRRERMRSILGILKDKLSLIKATLLLSTNRSSSFHVAVLRATTHHPDHPPPFDDVLALAHLHRPTSSGGALIHSLLRRLHRTRSAYVALKCLLTLHHILARDSTLLKDYFLSYSPCGPLFNLSTFRDVSDADTWGLSNWVRWYAGVLEQSLAISRQKRSGATISGLVNMVDQICRAPDSLYYQRISLIYEVMKLVGEDYRMIMREIFTRVHEFEDKIDDLCDDSLKELLVDLKRLEDCKEKVLLMFLNKKNNDGVWELIGELRRGVEGVKEKREAMRLVRFEGTRVGESRSPAVLPAPRVKRWLDVDWNPLVVSVA